MDQFFGNDKLVARSSSKKMEIRWTGGELFKVYVLKEDGMYTRVNSHYVNYTPTLKQAKELAKGFCN